MERVARCPGTGSRGRRRGSPWPDSPCCFGRGGRGDCGQSRTSAGNLPLRDWSTPRWRGLLRLVMRDQRSRSTKPMRTVRWVGLAATGSAANDDAVAAATATREQPAERWPQGRRCRSSRRAHVDAPALDRGRVLAALASCQFTADDGVSPAMHEASISSVRAWVKPAFVIEFLMVLPEEQSEATGWSRGVWSIGGQFDDRLLERLDAPDDRPTANRSSRKASCWPGSLNSWRPSQARRVEPQQVVGIRQSWSSTNSSATAGVYTVQPGVLQGADQIAQRLVLHHRDEEFGNSPAVCKSASLARAYRSLTRSPAARARRSRW